MCFLYALETETEYLPLIYKELLELKILYTTDRKETTEKFCKIEHVLSEMRENISNNEVADPFAEESIDLFDEAFPITKTDMVSTTNTKIFVDPLYKAKLVNYQSKPNFKNITVFILS